MRVAKAEQQRRLQEQQRQHLQEQQRRLQEQKPLLQLPDSDEVRPTWASDGERFAYLSNRDQPGSSQYDLFVGRIGAPADEPHRKVISNVRVSEDSLSAFIFNTTVLPATPLLLQRLAVFSASHQRCFSNALASLKSSLKVVSLEIDLAAVLGTILRLSWPRASRASRKPIES